MPSARKLSSVSAGGLWNGGDAADNPADWPVKVLDYNELRETNSGLVDIDGTVQTIRHSRHVRLGVWCAVVAIVCLAVAAVLVPSAMNFPTTQRLLTFIYAVIVGVFVVFTIPLFKWAQYPNLTMEERARLSDAREIAMNVRRVAASDLKRSYEFVDIMAEKDVLTAVKRGDMMVKEWEPGRSVDFFECPKDGRNRDFRIFYRKPRCLTGMISTIPPSTTGLDASSRFRVTGRASFPRIRLMSCLARRPRARTSGWSLTIPMVRHPASLCRLGIWRKTRLRCAARPGRDTSSVSPWNLRRASVRWCSGRSLVRSDFFYAPLLG